jgi:hypothetical protein
MQEDFTKIEQLLKKSRSVNSKNFAVKKEFRENLRTELVRQYVESEKKELSLLEKIKLISLTWKIKYLYLFMIVFFGILVSGVTYLLFYNKQETIQQNVLLAANLATADGIVTVKRNGSGEWIEALQGDILNEGDSLKSGTDSRAVLILDNGDAIRLNADSEIVLASFDPEQVVIEQVQGESYSRVTRSDTNTYTVIGQGVEAQALGTAYSFVNDVVNKKVNVYVYESKVTVTYGEDMKEIDELGKLIVDTEGNKIDAVEMSEEEYKASFALWSRDEDKKLGIPTNEQNPPVVTVTSPSNGAKTQEGTIAVQGKVTDDSKLRKIIVNGAIYITKDDGGKGFNPSDGTFDVDVALNEGENVVTIVAYDWYWNASTEATVSVTYEAPSTPTPTPKPTQLFYISSISSPADGGEFTVKWVLSNLDASHGFKIVKADHVNPVYPGDDNVYLDNQGARSYTWTGVNGGTYHVRVCIYNGNGGCLRYTNDKVISVNQVVIHTYKVTLSWTSDGDDCTFPTSIGLSAGNPIIASLNNSVGHLACGGGTSPQGYEVCWALRPNPTYGNDNCIRVSNTTSTITLPLTGGFESGKTYHFRVGAWDFVQNNVHDDIYSNGGNDVVVTMP